MYVITDLQVGGVPLHLCRLAQASSKRGFVPTVVSLAERGPVGKRMADRGIDVRSCGGRGSWDVRVLGRLARLMREIEPRIVHALLFHANLAARLAAWEVGLSSDRVICEIQTVEVERRWHLTVDRWTHRGCRFTIGNSASVLEHLARNARIPRQRLRLVRGGVDPEPFRTASPSTRSKLGLPPDAAIVLWVGRLDPVKGLPVLIDSFAALPSECKAHLLLAGAGPLREHIARQIARRGISSRARLLGPRDDVPGLLRAASVFAFPSRTEGLPNALLEAMAAGCPVVATDVPGCRDLVRHEVNGLVVPYGNGPALTAALRRLIMDEGFARRLGGAAAAEVQQRWHIDRTLAEYLSIYEEMQVTRPGVACRAIDA